MKSERAAQKKYDGRLRNEKNRGRAASSIAASGRSLHKRQYHARATSMAMHSRTSYTHGGKKGRSGVELRPMIPTPDGNMGSATGAITPASQACGFHRMKGRLIARATPPAMSKRRTISIKLSWRHTISA